MDIVVYPNSGEIFWNMGWSEKEGMKCTVKDISDLAVEWRDAGATIIGGCCRVTPNDIKQIYDKFNPQ